MKEAFDLIRKRMKKTTEFLSDCTKYGNKDAVQQRKSYDTMYMYEIALLVEELIDIVSEVEAEYINKSTEHINKSGDCSTGWIPCSERLPEEKGAVLVTYENTNDEVKVEVTMYEPKRKSFWVSPSVIAWMPLPSPYTTTTD